MDSAQEVSVLLIGLGLNTRLPTSVLNLIRHFSEARKFVLDGAIALPGLFLGHDERLPSRTNS